jgi:hypothetical protein
MLTDLQKKIAQAVVNIFETGSAQVIPGGGFAPPCYLLRRARADGKTTSRRKLRRMQQKC